MKTALMVAAIVALAVFVACSVPERPKLDIEYLPGTGDMVFVTHDAKRAVTCWVYRGYRRGGISCLRDVP